MIGARLENVDLNEILSYMGAGGKDIPSDELAKITRTAEQIRLAAQPRLVYRRVPITNGSIDGLELEGRDIWNLLDGADEAVVFAATLGHSVDMLISKLQVSDMAGAVIADACASASVENICDNFETDMRQCVESEGLYLTERYSPGYGDLPLETQKQLGIFLNCQRRIGLVVSDNCLMSPIKSVTAIMGITKQKKPCIIHRCETCTSRENCELRKSRERLIGPESEV